MRRHLANSAFSIFRHSVVQCFHITAIDYRHCRCRRHRLRIQFFQALGITFASIIVKKIRLFYFL